MDLHASQVSGDPDFNQTGLEKNTLDQVPSGSVSCVMEADGSSVPSAGLVSLPDAHEATH